MLFAGEHVCLFGGWIDAAKTHCISPSLLTPSISISLLLSSIPPSLGDCMLFAGELVCLFGGSIDAAKTLYLFSSLSFSFSFSFYLSPIPSSWRRLVTACSSRANTCACLVGGLTLPRHTVSLLLSFHPFLSSSLFRSPFFFALVTVYRIDYVSLLPPSLPALFFSCFYLFFLFIFFILIFFIFLFLLFILVFL